MKNSYLKEMGIDVWVLRDSPEAVAANTEVEQPVASQNVSKAIANNQAVGGDQLVDGSFHLCFLQYRTLAICVPLQPSEQVITGSSKRLCDDIALAVIGHNVQAQLQNLKWPQTRSDMTSEEIVQGKLNSLSCLCIVLGEQAARHLPNQEQLAKGQISTVNNRQYLLLDDIDKLTEGSNRKRLLWGILQSIRYPS